LGKLPEERCAVSVVGPLAEMSKMFTSMVKYMS
jgi:hypothetical protein